MNPSFTAFKSQQAVQKLRKLLTNIELFTASARMFNSLSGNLDARLLVQEGNRLLESLRKTVEEFRYISSDLSSVRRALPKTAPTGILPPAAQWGNEFRALSNQITDAVCGSEVEIRKLLDTGTASMNLPSRTATEPENVIELVVLFADLLSRYIEYLKTHKRD